MNIYIFIPLVATIAYIPLLLSTIGARPRHRQHILLLLFLIAACLWSLADFIFRSNYFPGAAAVLIRIIICLFSWMAIQFHCLSSSFFQADKRHWLPLAYGSLALIVGFVAFGIIPHGLVQEGATTLPEYGWSAYIIAIPLLLLAARNIYVFWPRLKNQDNPVIFNQTVSLLLCLGVLIVSISLAISPFSGAFSLAYIGNIIVALVLSYTVVGHQMVDIRYVLRRGFAWTCVGIISIASFWFILLIFHDLIDSQLTTATFFAAATAAIISVLILYKARVLMTRLIGKVFQGESFNYRKKLTEFADKIHNVFSLKDQGNELLKLTTRALDCSKAGLLFGDNNGDYEAQIIASVDKNDALGRLKIRGDNPVIEYLKRKRSPLTRESLFITPEFLGLWQQEKEAIETNGIEVFVPLISRERLIGLLVLDKKKTGYYNLEDFTLLEDIAARVAVSMEKEYLREQLKEREEELSVINRSNAVISSTLDIQRNYDNFIKELKSMVNVDWASIEVIEDGEIYFMAIFTEIGSPWKVGERIPLKGTAAEWVANHHRPFIEGDLAVESRFVTGKYHRQHSLRSIAFLPLVISNQVIGVLTVASRQPDAYNSRHIKLLEQLAAQISMPIENARLYARTERMARVDSLTGLLNRRSLDEILVSEIGRHSRYGGVFSLIILDLDSFKAVNDTYGHPAGDEILSQIGIIMRNAIRESDRAFRYGGDEFAILLPQTSIEAAFKVAERIRQQTYARVEIGSKPISLSLGLACWPADGVASNDVVAAADAALYQSKRVGGNRSLCSVIKFQPVANGATVNSMEPLNSNVLSALFAMAATVDARDRFNQNHSKKVHEYSTVIGIGLGMKSLELNLLGTCALLHDIGKIGISDGILNKQEVLSEKEWEVIKSHSMLGAAIVSHNSQLSACVAGILHHHEKFDGTGYPDGLRGEEIPLESRVLAIADAFATMTSPRVYARELTFKAAIEEIRRGSGAQFDPKLVTIFLEEIFKISASSTQPIVGTEKT